MKLRRLGIVAAALVALAALLALVALRFGLAAGPVRAALETRLSATIGQPVALGSLRVSFFPRFALTGTAVRVGGEREEAPSIQVARVTVLPRLRTLFGGTVVIQDVLLDGFTVSLLRTADGTWRVPSVAPSPGASAAGGVAIERIRVTNGQIRVYEQAGSGMRLSSGIGDVEADLVTGAEGLRIAPMRGRVGSAAISGEASVNAKTVRLQFAAPSVADADLAPLLALAASERPTAVRLDQPASVTITLTIARAAARLTGAGTLAAPAVTIGPVRVERMEAPFKLSGTRLTFAPTTFATSGGAHRGTVVLDLGAEPPRWSIDSALERLDTGAFLDAVAGRDTHVDGAGQIDANLHGPLDERFVQGMAGRARLLVSNGVLRDFPLIAAVNRTLQLAEAESQDTRFERLSATLSIAGAVATTDDLAIDAGHLRVLAAGRIGFDGPLDLRGRVIVSKERAAEAVARVHELARLRTGGEMVLPLTISGTLDQPRFGIDLKAAVGQGLKDELMRRLRRIIK